MRLKVARIAKLALAWHKESPAAAFPTAASEIGSCTLASPPPAQVYVIVVSLTTVGLWCANSQLQP